MPEEAVQETPVEEIVTTEEEKVEQKQEPESDKEFVNPHARARVLERNNRILQDRVNLLTEKFLEIAETQGASRAESAVDETDDDWTANPLDVIRRELTDLKGKLIENEKRQEQNRTVAAQNEGYVKAVRTADALIQDKLREDPDGVKSALLYLGGVIREEIIDDNPDLTDNELMIEAEKRINSFKIKCLREGRNPADEFIKRAKRYGYKPEKKVVSDSGDAKEQITKEKERDSKSRTISTIEGSSPKTRPNFAKLRDGEFDRIVNEGIKSGKMRRAPGAFRTPPMRDLIPHKLTRGEGP
jgi:hypothetical protein